MKKVTIKDIALLAQVHPCVVSHVFHKDAYAAHVRPETRERILSIAAQEGYVLNSFARAMSTGQSRTIGFLLETQYMFVEYVQQMLSYILQTVDRYDYSLKLFSADSSSRGDVLRRIREEQISGMLLHHYRLEDLKPWLRDFRSVEIPCCVVDMKNDTGIGGGVISDDAAGMEEAVSYLAGLGHRRIEHLGADFPDWNYVIEREKGYRCGMSRIAGAHPVSHHLQFGELGCNLEYLKSLLQVDSGLRPTAFVCDSDYVAMEAFQAAYQLHLRIPEELSLIGFGCLAPALYGPVALTTVQQPFDRIGGDSAELLLEHIVHGGDLDGRNILLPNRLRIADSTSVPFDSEKR